VRALAPWHQLQPFQRPLLFCKFFIFQIRPCHVQIL
jgi:hypothetical protein